MRNSGECFNYRSMIVPDVKEKYPVGYKRGFRENTAGRVVPLCWVVFSIAATKAIYRIIRAENQLSYPENRRIKHTVLVAGRPFTLVMGLEIGFTS